MGRCVRRTRVKAQGDGEEKKRPEAMPVNKMIQAKLVYREEPDNDVVVALRVKAMGKISYHYFPLSEPPKMAFQRRRVRATSRDSSVESSRSNSPVGLPLPPIRPPTPEAQPPPPERPPTPEARPPPPMRSRSPSPGPPPPPSPPRRPPHRRSQPQRSYGR